MCNCSWNYVCSKCRETPFADAVLDTAPLTLAEWDDLVCSEQNATVEPFEGWKPGRL